MKRMKTDQSGSSSNRWKIAPPLYIFPILAFGILTWTGFKKNPTSRMVLMFDDFNYSGIQDPALDSFNHWEIVNGPDGPPSGAFYSSSNIQFSDDPSLPGNRIMDLLSTCSPHGDSLLHSRIQTSNYPFVAGTFAARVHFDDAPSLNQDAAVQTFYAIADYNRYGADPSHYGEIDFEYLPWDIWGATQEGKSMYMTSYRVAEPTPIKASISSSKDWKGWHTLLFSYLNQQQVNFWIDGQLMGRLSKSLDSTAQSIYPGSPLQVAFANWISRINAQDSSNSRTYKFQVDWFLYIKGEEISTKSVESIVQQFRDHSIVRENLEGQ
ncbi:MAG: glycoside hydrolase family 16 protein [Chitinophagaceae bacterium]